MGLWKELGKRGYLGDKKRSQIESDRWMRISDEHFRLWKEIYEPTPEVKFGIGLGQKIWEEANKFYESDENKQTNQRTSIGTKSGDTEYPIDDLAEKIVEDYFKAAWKDPSSIGHNFGYVTENQGLKLPPSGNPDIIWMVDPIDGSRLKERQTVTMVGVPGNIPNPTLDDIKFAVITPIKHENGVSFFTKQIDGKTVVAGTTKKGNIFPVKRSDMSDHIHPEIQAVGDLSSRPIILETFSVSPDLMGIILREIINSVNYKKEFLSGSASMLSIVLEEEIAYADFRKDVFEKFSHLNPKSDSHAKGGMMLDVAAGIYMLEARGGVATDYDGNRLTGPLWLLNENNEWTDQSHITVLAAATPELHKQLRARATKGFDRLKSLETFFQQINNGSEIEVYKPSRTPTKAYFPGMD